MVYEEDREATLKAIEDQIAENGHYDKVDYRIEKKDGSIIWVHDEGHYVVDNDNRSWFYVTINDISEIVEEKNELREENMKCIIDVVYNHTSPDSVLAKEHPEWFYHKPDGSFGNKVGDWSDVIDLNYDQRQLWDYQIETLKRWTSIVDGFRCDVAPLVPLAFWLKAREETAKVKPDLLWLSESVEPDFIRELRSRGVTCLSDSEIFQAFDVSYEYDVYSDFNAYLKGTGSLAEYAAALNRQESIYPDNYVKLRFLENHGDSSLCMV